MNTRNDTFGLFSDRVIDLANYVFSPMYQRVFKRYWDNSTFARMRKPYFESNMPNGFYEICIPTFEDLEWFNMRCYRIVFQTVPELDKEIWQKEALKLRKTRVADGRGPAGRMDSKLIVVVAPRLSDRAGREKQFLRAHRTYPKVNGFLTAAIINPEPETCARRLLRIVVNFLKRRIIRKVGSTAVLDPQVQHNPKDLAAACFVQTVLKMNLGTKVHLSHTPQHQVLRYVHRIMPPVWSSEKNGISWNGQTKEEGENSWQKERLK